MTPDQSQLLKDIDRLRAAKNFNDALALSQKNIHSFTPTWPLMLKTAEVYEDIRDYKTALTLYQRVHQGVQADGEKSTLSTVVAICRCFIKLEDFKNAQRLLSELSAKFPDQLEVMLHTASCERHAKRLEEARNLVSAVLKKSPQYAPAIHELGRILIEEKKYEEAVTVLEANVRREEFFGDSIDLWIHALGKLNRNRYAQDVLEELMKKHPNTLEFSYGFAVLANRAGEAPLARPAYEHCLRLSPQNFRIAYEYGVLERVEGNLQKSQELIGRALSLKPDNPAALRTFANDVKYEYGDENFQRLNLVAARLTEFSDIEQVHLHYALAKAFEDVSELDTAFRHYALGGEKKRRIEKYDEKNATHLNRMIPKVVNKANLKATGDHGFKSDVPVFILGMPRSGTSLLEQILSAHPDVFGAGELKYLVGVIENMNIGKMRLRMGDEDPVFPYDDNAGWEARGEKFVEKLEKLAGTPYKRIVDKMPGNFNFVGVINAILPNARIIHSRRHPVETCLSCYRIHFAEGHVWTYNLRELGRYYRRYWELMRFWRTEFPGLMYEIRYEDNVADTEGQARGLIDFLGLPWNDRCLEFHKVDRPVKTASVTQVRKPIYKSSTNRWRKYEKYLGPLLEELGDIVDEYEKEIEHLIEK